MGGRSRGADLYIDDDYDGLIDGWIFGRLTELRVAWSWAIPSGKLPFSYFLVEDFQLEFVYKVRCGNAIYHAL